MRASMLAAALVVTCGCDPAPPPPARAPAPMFQVPPPPAAWAAPPVVAPPPRPALTWPPLPTQSVPAGRCAISTATFVPPEPKPKPPADPTAAPSASASPAAPPSVPNAAAVVAAAAPGFRRCYNRALGLNPDEVGVVRVGARIDAAGCVVATSAASKGLADRTVACVVDRVRQMEFEAPDGGGATVIIPVTFVTDPAAPPPPQP